MKLHSRRHLFSAYGLEIEYMIVDRRTLEVRPIADRFLRRRAGLGDQDLFPSEVDAGPMGWSNELVLHVAELKAAQPTERIADLVVPFQEEVAAAHRLLEAQDAMLLPSAMHPWMDPLAEMRLWPHDGQEFYSAFHRIFDCRGHGWANLQSVHLNLPFAGDDEFARLHAAVRLVLPMLPALAASSPFVEGRIAGALDFRLEVYRANCRRIPSVTGSVIPEPVYSEAEYRETILERMYREIAPFDPEGTLQHEWLNARGAIARFERSAIEIRVLDSQESPRSDLAICALVAGVLQRLVREEWTPLAQQKLATTDLLDGLLQRAVRDAEAAVVGEPEYLAHFGFRGGASITAHDFWTAMIDNLGGWDGELAPWRAPLEAWRNEGPLARRLLRAAGPRPSREDLERLYRRLAECLAAGEVFESADLLVNGR